MVSAGTSSDVAALLTEVETLRGVLIAAEAMRADEIAAVHPAHRRSATNLVHYLALRSHDVRDLQAQLAALGLSSLGRSEAHVLATIETVLGVLARLDHQDPPTTVAAIGIGEGRELLDRNTDLLLGPPPTARSTRIMVTMPSEAATDVDLVAGMVARGMDVARVNCAHDDIEAWGRMVDHLRAMASTDGRPCRIAMDLAGPKLRTGPLQPGPRAVRVAPRRDQLGRVVAPALVWLTCTGEPAPAGGAQRTVVPIDDPDWGLRRRVGDRLEVSDSRGKRRHWDVVEVDESGCLASMTQTTYLATGLTIRCQTADGGDPVTVGELPVLEQAHRVVHGDRIVLTRSLEPAPATAGGTTHVIGCTLPEAFRLALPGERVWLDDGKIGGFIDNVTDDEIEFVVTDVGPNGANLRAAKGINLPDTDLRLDALTPKDLQDLEFAARHADIVDLSFVRRPTDVEQLQGELERLGAGDVGIVLKIENVMGFENLPELLLTAMRSRKVGVMIARGDLAVEVGFDRMAEVQEEIMWVCEAAHVPVIWATQVLDTLARTGQPSRAEVTDAAMSERAECVMLNKGPYIAEAITALDSILSRMRHHQDKKRSLLRRLRAWDHTLDA